MFKIDLKSLVGKDSYSIEEVKALYLDYKTGFVALSCFAAYYGMELSVAEGVIDMGKCLEGGTILSKPQNVEFVIECDPRIELGDLVTGLSTAFGVSYSEAENMLPGYIFEGSHIGDDIEDMWAQPIVSFLKSMGIDSIEVYQDS